jgi:hypothetical protein
VARKSWERMSGTEKLDSLKKDLAVVKKSLGPVLAKLDHIEQRFDDADKTTKSDVARLSQSVSELNVRLGAVAANVFAISVAADASKAAAKPEPKIPLWPDHPGDRKT